MEFTGWKNYFLFLKTLLTVFREKLLDCDTFFQSDCLFNKFNLLSLVLVLVCLFFID